MLVQRFELRRHAVAQERRQQMIQLRQGIAAVHVESGRRHAVSFGQHHSMGGHVSAANLHEIACAVLVHPQGGFPDPQRPIDVHQQHVEYLSLVVGVFRGRDARIEIDRRLADERLLLLQQCRSSIRAGLRAGVWMGGYGKGCT